MSARMRWITFDCFGTLVDWQTGFADAIRPFAGERTEDVLSAYRAHEAVVEREKPHRSYKEVLVAALARAAKESDLTLSVEAVRALPQAWATMRVFDDVEPMLAELRLLASGFLDLSVALSTTPTRTNVEAPKTTAREPVSGPPPPNVTSPVPVTQDLPVWVPTDQASRREFRGAIRVFISDVGRVTGAEISSPIHPAYDRQLLLAAKAWTYQPALKDGRPMASEKVIEVVLKPR